jgi:hypothetical protein
LVLCSLMLSWVGIVIITLFLLNTKRARHDLEKKNHKEQPLLYDKMEHLLVDFLSFD